MFINQGDLVRVKSGRMAGHWGRLTKIRLCNQSGDALAFVDLYREDNEASAIHLFKPEEMERMKATPFELEQSHLRMDKQQNAREWREINGGF